MEENIVTYEKEPAIELTAFDVDYWVRENYPLTIISDRYGGCYSKARYLAFPCDFFRVPREVDGGDVECMDFWGNKDDFMIGKGATVEDALSNLQEKLKKVSEDFPYIPKKRQ